MIPTGKHEGSVAGYLRHRRRKERACLACRREWAKYYRKGTEDEPLTQHELHRVDL